MKKLVKITLYFILPILIVLIVCILAFLPKVVRSYANEHGKELIGRKISINQVHINYLNANLTIVDFRFFEPDEQTPFVKFDTLLIDFEPWHLVSSELFIEKIRLVKPEVTINRKDTTFNFDDIIAFLNSKPKENMESKPSVHKEPFKYSIKNTTLDRGEINL